MFTYTNQSPPLACRSVCSTLSMRRSQQEAIVEAIQHEIMLQWKARKALYNIVLNQMSPRHISGILYEYPQFTMWLPLFLVDAYSQCTRVLGSSRSASEPGLGRCYIVLSCCAIDSEQIASLPCRVITVKANQKRWKQVKANRKSENTVRALLT